MWLKALILIKLEHGGYLVKNHDVYNGDTQILFAGSLPDCLVFMEDFMGGLYPTETAKEKVNMPLDRSQG